MANPDGSFTLTQSTTPQRVDQGNGSWGAVDASLEHSTDERLAPKGSVVKLSFSDGGPGADLVRLEKDGGSVALGWPGTLPTPTLSGATATYADVLDGVDLQMTATAEGYREVLVVKTPQAAQNPELEQIRLAAKGDGLTVVPGAGGGLRAVDEDGNAVFRGPAGLMWDSAGGAATDSPTLQPRRATSSRSDTSDGERGDGEVQTQPGDGDVSAVLPVAVDESGVEVHPDLSLLRGTETVYPVYIDPSVGLGASERTVLSSDGDKFWSFDDDMGVGKCGSADGYYCGSGYVNRMYYEFAPTKLAGAYVLDATFRAHETWSFNCDPHWVDLERTDNISEGTRWPGPKDLDQMGDRYVSAGRGSRCSPDQPADWVEFNDNPEEPDENLKSTVASFADGKISRLTLMLRAKDEGDARAWKRFDKNAELKVNFAYKPGTPANVGLIPGDGTTAYCKTSASDPLIVTRVDPMVQAAVETKVEAHKGDEEGSLQAEFVVERGDDAAWHQVWSGYRPSSGWDPDGTLEKMRTSNRADGGLYRYRARTQSHWSYSGKSGDLFSSYSSWCYFKIDSTAPKAPQIAPDPASATHYTACTADDCTPAGGPGVAGSFLIQPNSADKDITGYEWRLLTEKNARTVTGSSVKVDVTPGMSGTQTLSVRAKDVRSRWGTYSEFTFKVAPRQGAVGTWHFDDGLPGSSVTAAQDSATVGTRHAATLHTAGAGWSTLARRGNQDYSLWLNNGTSTGASATGYADTAAAAVNTGDSFTVSAWVNLADTTENHVVLCAPGAYGCAFTLYYSATYHAWVFNRTATDAGSAPVYLRSVGADSNPPANVWTHLAAVYRTENAEGVGDADSANDTIQLFVNGRAQGDPVVLSTTSSHYTPWTASGGLQFGRSLVGGEWGEYFRGRIDEVSVWQQALSPQEILQESRAMDGEVPANELVADWDAASSTGTALKQLSAYAVPDMKLSPTGATLNDDTDDVLVLDGTNGYASIPSGPVVDEGGSFTVSAGVRLNKASLAAKPVGYTAQVAGQRTGNESSWAIWVTKPADDTYQWKFTRTAVGADGKVTQSASVPGSDPAETDTWVQVTGVYDAQEGAGNLHLYVGGFDQQSDEQSSFTAVQQGSGELAVGRGGASGSVGNYLPGALQDLRIWTGAMTADQISSQVLGAPSSG
ncbi:LamG domain-containing protein [Streptomyces sp. NPDC059740]|uniref:LamG domain-containing protein n=1 Tax=Streptomyces sp. NPDC059740 TaxID=3346926 RepID=UPI0036553C75